MKTKPSDRTTIQHICVHFAQNLRREVIRCARLVALWFVFGLSLSVSHANSVLAYDSLSRLTTITCPDGSRIEYTYDANGNRLTHRITGPQFMASMYPEDSEIPAIGGSVQIELTANGAWTVSADRDWASVLPASGPGSGNLTVTVPASTSYRTRDVRITVGNAVHTLRQAPKIGEVTASVSEALSLPVAGEGTILSVSGLPSGMSYNAAQGALVGRPNAAGLYTVSIRANIPGRGTVEDQVILRVDSLPSLAVGTFTSMIWPPEPSPNTLEGMGGILTLTSSSSGSYTGSLIVGSNRYSFTGRIEGKTSADHLESRATIVTNSRDRSKDINLNLVFRTEEHATLPGLTGNLTYEGRTVAMQPGWKQLWSAKDNPAWGNRDRTLNVALVNQTAQGPQGTGFATIKLTKAGLVLWTGTLADGRTFTASHTASPAGDIPLYASIPYAGKGAITALLGTEMVGELIKTIPDSANGRWIKRGSTSVADRILRDGFDTELGIEGAEYIKPATGQLLFSTPVAPAAMTFRLDQGGLESSGQLGGAASLDLDAQLLAGNKITVEAGELPENVKLKLDFTASSGACSGSISLSDPSPLNGKAVERKLSFNGLYIPDLGAPGQSAVHGFFTLPELPDAAGETSSNTPVNSGRIELGR